MLNNERAARLTELFEEWVGGLDLDLPAVGEHERAYTARELLPRVANWTSGLSVASLVVRGDGGVPSHSVALQEMLFYPDIEIAEHSARYVAVEVKILRGAQSSGAVTKAIGQAVIYRSLGFLSAHVLIIDARIAVGNPARSVADWEVLDGAGLNVDWFVPENGRLRNARR